MGGCLSLLPGGTHKAAKHDEFTSLQQIDADSASHESEVTDSGKPLRSTVAAAVQQQKQQRSAAAAPPTTATVKRSAADYMIEKISSQTIVRGSGSIGGEAFAIDEVSDSHIYLLDNLAAVTIDRVDRSYIIVGPTEGSVFLRDCSDTVLIIAANQVRLRDCHRCKLYLYCSASQPVIESSSQIAINGYPLSYTGLQQQLTAAGLHPFNTQYDNVHDFTAAAGKLNWSYGETVQQPFTAAAYNTIIPDLQQNIASYNQQHADTPLELSLDGQFTIPYAIGMRNSKTSSARSLLLLVGGNNNSNTTAATQVLLSRLQEISSDIQLQRSKHQAVNKSQVSNLHTDIRLQLQDFTAAKHSYDSLICMEIEYCSDEQLNAISSTAQQMDTGLNGACLALMTANVNEVASHHFALQRM